MINRLTDSLDFHSQALVLRSERQRLIASNIANADTPGYKARDFDFASALRAATGASSSGGRGGSGIGSGMGSDIGQGIAGSVMDSSGRAAPRLRYSVPNQTGLDNNSVDMDRERAAFMDNAVNYESTLRFINSSVRTMLEAMRSPNQG